MTWLTAFELSRYKACPCLKLFCFGAMWNEAWILTFTLHWRKLSVFFIQRLFFSFLDHEFLSSPRHVFPCIPFVESRECFTFFYSWLGHSIIALNVTVHFLHMLPSSFFPLHTLGWLRLDQQFANLVASMLRDKRALIAYLILDGGKEQYI